MSKPTGTSRITYRRFEDADIDLLYDLVKQNARLNRGKGANILLSSEELKANLNRQCGQCFFILSRHEENKIVGYMLTQPEYSAKFGGYGIRIDQHYILPAYMTEGGSGLLRVMVAFAEMRNVPFIKLVQQEHCSITSEYAKTGFIGYYSNMHGLRLFELSDQERLAVFLDQNIKSLKRPYTIYVETENHTIAGITNPQHVIVSAMDRKKEQYTLGELQADNGAYSEYEQHDVSEYSELELPFPVVSTCRFTEQVTLCARRGKLLRFSDFDGNAYILTPQIIQQRVKLWNAAQPDICGVVWEVPCGPNTAARPGGHSGKSFKRPDSEYSHKYPLATRLEQLGATDETRSEGWVISLWVDRGKHRYYSQP